MSTPPLFPLKPPRTILNHPLLSLVPYLPIHVPTYHSWMSNPAMLEATASEPLTESEEYEMCDKWLEDAAKATFILLWDADSSEHNEDIFDNNTISAKQIQSKIPKMVGDVNVFLSHSEPQYDEDYNPLPFTPESPQFLQGEIEIMIASTTAQRRGLATTAVKMMMAYASKVLGVKRFFVKIKDGNVGSRRLFEGLGFEFLKYVEYFEETELDFAIDGDGYEIEGWDLEGNSILFED